MQFYHKVIQSVKSCTKFQNHLPRPNNLVKIRYMQRMDAKVAVTGLKLATLHSPIARHDTNKCCNSPAYVCGCWLHLNTGQTKLSIKI